MSWLERIDRKPEHPLGAWARIDGALQRLSGWRIFVTVAVLHYFFVTGSWIWLSLFSLYIVAAMVTEFVPAPPPKPTPPAQTL